MIRLCTHTGRACNCNDAESQPCIAALIAEFLDTLRWNVLTEGADGGPGDGFAIWCAHQDVMVTTHAFETISELEIYIRGKNVNWPPNEKD
jgi:hypothetical protein